MYVINPPAVPEGFEVKSADPGIRAVEHACAQAGVKYDVLDHPVLGEGTKGWPEVVHIVLPDIGVHLAIATATNSVIRDRYLDGQIVLDGQQGIDTLVGILSSLRKA